MSDRRVVRCQRMCGPMSSRSGSTVHLLCNQTLFEGRDTKDSWWSRPRAIRWPGNTWGRSSVFEKPPTINQDANSLICHYSSQSAIWNCCSIKPWIIFYFYSRGKILAARWTWRLKLGWIIMKDFPQLPLSTEDQKNLKGTMIEEQSQFLSINCSVKTEKERPSPDFSPPRLINNRGQGSATRGSSNQSSFVNWFSQSIH